MKRLFATVLFTFLLTQVVAMAESADQIREYKVQGFTARAKELDGQLASIRSKVRIGGVEVVERLVNSRASSWYGTIEVKCDGGTRIIPVGIVFSASSASSLSTQGQVRAQMMDEGLHPVDTTEHATAFLLGSAEAQIALERTMAKYTIGSCVADKGEVEKIGYNFSISLWLSAAEDRYNFGFARVHPEEFEKLK